MTRPLVSLVTPCCNGEAFLGRYFSCVLSQTYPRIEVVLVDDGSTDSTLAVAEAHRPALEARGYRLVCLRQEHAGQAAAVNRGLAAAAGEYIAWPDSDDLMRPDNVGRKARYLDEHPEAGFVCCQVALVDEGDPARVLAVRRVEDTGDPWLFDRLIRDKGAFCLDIAYLARASALFDALGGRRIAESPVGQNLQLLLPLAYRYPCGFIDEPLVSYVARAGSHSRSFSGARERLERNLEFERLLRRVVASIPMGPADRAVYARYAAEKFLPERFDLAVAAGDVACARETGARLDGARGRSALRGALALACAAGLGAQAVGAANVLRRAKGAVLRAAGRGKA